METSIKYKIDQQNLILKESNKQFSKLLELKSIKTIEIFESFDDRLKNIEKQLSTIHETMLINVKLLQEEKKQQEITLRYSNEDNTQNIILPTFDTLLEEDSFEDNTDNIFPITTTDPQVQKKNYEKEIINAIKNKDINKAVKLSKYGQKNFNIWIEILYDGNQTTTENILLFLNNLPDINDQILGYRALYHLIYINDHEISSLSTSIAYQAVNVFNKTHSENSDLISLLEDLPESLTKLQWNNWVNITNHALGVEVLCLGISTVDDHYLVNAGKLPYHRDTYHSWKIYSETNGTSFVFQSFAFLQYLHVVSAERSYNKLPTTAITRLDENIVSPHLWRIIPILDSDYIYIQYIASDEYLCAKNNLSLEMLKFNQLQTNSDTKKMCQWKISLSYP